jgi:glycosyltransferase involved in cell wall biosynthesis
VSEEANRQYVLISQESIQVFVTTDFTKQDAIQFAGLPSKKVIKLPMLVPEFTLAHQSKQPSAINDEGQNDPYFLWPTNLAIYKNHQNAFKALQIYYEQLNGQLECCVTGVNTKDILKSNIPHLILLKELVDGSPPLQQKLNILGELTDSAYQDLLGGSSFLWHAGRVDNGTFTVIEAAHLGVPSLSSDYPAMHEIDEQFALNLSWMNAESPLSMAQQLKWMESQAELQRKKVPDISRLRSQAVDVVAGSYWQAVREWL